MNRPFCKKDFDDLAKMMDNEQDFNAFKNYQILSLDRQLFHNHLSITSLPPLPEGEFDHLWQKHAFFHCTPVTDIVTKVALNCFGASRVV